MNCEECSFYEYDDEEEEYFCSVNMDEDEYARLLEQGSRECPYFRFDNEYEIVKHQM
ncbi:MAG: hypothetical protein IJM62_00530 [Lachnospiraceae bacterium]|nr:hypothetical protein [Lachnospiraceae bacterium]